LKAGIDHIIIMGKLLNDSQENRFYSLCWQASYKQKLTTCYDYNKKLYIVQYPNAIDPGMRQSLKKPNASLEIRNSKHEIRNKFELTKFK